MKKCPFCAEEIQDEAIKCRFCGEFLQTGHQVAQQPVSNRSNKAIGSLKKLPWFVGFLFLGPFVIPFIWGNPNYSKNKKIVLTVVVSIISILLLWAVIWAVQSIVSYYKIIWDMFEGIS